MKPEHILIKLGMGKKEIAIYMALLKMGEANITDLAMATGQMRTSIYTQIESLLHKGAIEFYVNKRRKAYVAVAPQELLLRFRSNVQDLEDNLKLFTGLLAAAPDKPTVRLYENKDINKLIFDVIIADKRELLAITSIEDAGKIMGDDFFFFIERRIRQHLPVKLLTNRSRSSYGMRARDVQSYRQTRFLPETHAFHTMNYVFGNKVAIISLSRGSQVGLLIEDPAIAATFRVYFDLLWRQASQS